MAKDKPYRFNDDNSKSPVILIGVLLIAIILVGGALLFVITNKQAPVVTPPVNITQPPPIANVTNVTSPPVCDDQCILSQAIANQNSSACEAISSSSIQQSCFQQLSNVSLDACKSVADQNIRNACITSFAVSSKDSTLCDLLTNTKAQCQLAVDPCLNSTDKKLCYALDMNDSSKCLGDTQCLLNYSSIRHDASACSGIADTVTSTACASAATLNDKCGGLSETANRDLCYDLYATYSSNYIFCTYITSDSIYSLDCYSHEAALMGNLSICNADGLTLDNLWACYRNYSLISGDLSGCNAIDKLATTNRYLCASQFAIKYGNPAACEVIVDSLQERSTCYEGAIIYSPQNLNWQTCGNVSDFNWQNECYVEAAKLDHNESLCNLISASYAQQSCMASYNLNQSNQ